ncbi:MAG: hypothetical protein HOZ81_30115 [Streptomyces sp.]|nr:hypothetical protein [Streptomyces sp.]
MITPKLEYLRHLAREQIDHELSSCLMRTGRLAGELAAAEERHRTAEHEARRSRLVWEEAREPPPEEDLKERRLAELSREDRPDSLVRARRMADHARRLAAAETDWTGAEERLAAAVHVMEELRRQIAYEESGSRARARRIHEFISRRAATYLQQLVRTHRRGPDLNAHLQLLGPELPAWAREPAGQNRTEAAQAQAEAAQDQAEAGQDRAEAAQDQAEAGQDRTEGGTSDGQTLAGHDRT